MELLRGEGDNRCNNDIEYDNNESECLTGTGDENIQFENIEEENSSADDEESVEEDSSDTDTSSETELETLSEKEENVNDQDTNSSNHTVNEYNLSSTDNPANEKGNGSSKNIVHTQLRNQKVRSEKSGNYLSFLGPESFSQYAQEPWPNDVKLYQPYEVEQILLPDNANCLAVQAFLRMCQLEYTVESRANAEAMSPTGRVPFIKCGAFVVSELEGIVQFVNNRGISLTEKLDNEEKADMRAYMCLVHNVLEKAELFICWMDNETYNEVTKVRHGSVYPWPLNHIQNWSKRNSVMKNLKVWNWYDKRLEEVFQEVENACQALSDRLDGKDYFFGSRTELDALVFGHIYSLCTTSSHFRKFKNLLEKFQPLLRHCKRICELMEKETESIEDLLKSELGKRN